MSRWRRLHGATCTTSYAQKREICHIFALHQLKHTRIQWKQHRATKPHPLLQNRRRARHGTDQAPPEKHVFAKPQCRLSCCVFRPRGSCRHTAVRARVLCVVSTERRAWNLSANNRYDRELANQRGGAGSPFLSAICSAPTYGSDGIGIHFFWLLPFLLILRGTGNL